MTKSVGKGRLENRPDLTFSEFWYNIWDMDTRERTEKKVFSYMEEYGMVSPGERIVLGVSGGADSVCLLLLLLAYRESVPLSLAVVHVNHGIRPDAAEDARYVEALCGEKGISFFLTDADVYKFAREEKCSEEDAGRRVRYDALRRAAKGWGGTKIAVAHNSDDNAETMLFHLFRGSGIGGLGGIAPVRRDEAARVDIIRPILCLERREVEAYLLERRTAWRTDSTNREDAYIRNRIRHHVLPYVERDIAAGAVPRMCRTAELLRETEDFLEQQTLNALQVCLAGKRTEGSGAYVLEVERFKAFHVTLQKRMLFALVKRLSPTGKDITAVHIQEVLSLFAKEKHRAVHLPFGITASRQYGRVVLERRGETARALPPVTASVTEHLFLAPAVYGLGEACEVEFFAFYRKKGQEVSRNQYTKWFDYDKIDGYVEIRTRRQGDFLTIAGGAGNTVHKSLKDYMITEKIPRQLRDGIPVLAVENHILWLVGWRISEHFKVDGDTRRILQVRFSAQKENTECEGSETEEKNVGTHQGTFDRGRSGCKNPGHRGADQ